MFYKNRLFNIDLSNWDTSKIIGMQLMFYGATAFNQDLSTWDFSKIDFAGLDGFVGGDEPIALSSKNFSRLDSNTLLNMILRKCHIYDINNLEFCGEEALNKLVSLGWYIKEH